MLASRKVVFSSFVLLGIVLGGCKLLKKGDADGGLDGAVEDMDAAPAAVDTAAVVDADAGAAAATTATTATTVTRIVPKTDGGLVDAGAKPVDAGAVVTVVDAGAAPVAPTTPTTPVTPTTPTAPEPGTCCCDVPGGAKTILTQKECMTTKKGACVPLASCGLKFKRPGQK